MREYLFRGKATNRDPNHIYRTNYKNGDWVYGLVSDFENYRGFSVMTNTDGVSDIDVDKNTIGQYTGLIDRNGKKIFEGDIVKTKTCRLCEVYWFYSPNMSGWDLKPVEFKNPAPTTYDLFKSDNLEVVGNIYDNPELLEESH